MNKFRLVQTRTNLIEQEWTSPDLSRKEQAQTRPDKIKLDWTGMNKSRLALAWNSENYCHEILRITNMKFWELQWPSLYKEVRHVQGVQCSAGCHSLLLYFYIRTTRQLKLDTHLFVTLKLCRCEPERQLWY